MKETNSIKLSHLQLDYIPPFQSIIFLHFKVFFFIQFSLDEILLFMSKL